MPRIRPVAATLLLTAALAACATAGPAALTAAPAPAAAVTLNLLAQAQVQGEVQGVAGASDDPSAAGTDDMYWD
jgi:predicted component of type VI protein secretion system